MKTKKALLISLCFNFLFLSLFLSLSYIYRDKLYQRFVLYKGDAKIVMFGNSITAQGIWVELLGRTDVANSGLPGQSTYYFLKMIQSHVIDLHPKICFVKGGINDITVGVAPEKLQANYRLILETLVHNNIIPVVTLTFHERNNPTSKVEVDNLNKFLVNYCREHHIKYLNLNQYLSDSTGLKAEFAADQTHLNRNGYVIWAKEIKKILKEEGI